MKPTLTKALVTVLLCGTSVAAEADSLGKIVGTGKTIVQALSGFIGETDVTPSYMVYYWTGRYWGYYAGVPYRHYYAVRRDGIMGRYFYGSSHFQGDVLIDASEEPFPVNTLKRYSYRCDMAPWAPDLYVHNEVEDFSVAVWVSALKKTGYFPPGEPYTAWIKTVGTRIAENCDPPTTNTREFRSSVAIQDTGFSILKPGWPGYQYTFPFLCWVGDCYDY